MVSKGQIVGIDSAMLLVSSYEPTRGCVAARCGSSQYILTEKRTLKSKATRAKVKA